MNDCSVIFKYKIPLITEIKDIISKTPHGTFDVNGQLEWLEESRNVLCSAPQKEVGHSSSVQITVWGELVDPELEGIKIEMTSAKLDSHYKLKMWTYSWTTIDLPDKKLHCVIYDLLSETKTWCCNMVLQQKHGVDLLCVIKDCRKNTTPWLWKSSVQ